MEAQIEIRHTRIASVKVTRERVAYLKGDVLDVAQYGVPLLSGVHLQRRELDEIE